MAAVTVPASAFKIAANRVEYACGCVSWQEWQHRHNRWWTLWSRDWRCKVSHP